MKKVLAVVLGLMLAITSLVPVFAIGSDSPDIDYRVSDSEITLGETVTITISVSGYEPIRSGALAFQFNQDVLEVVEGEWLVKNTLLAHFDKEQLKAAFACANAQDISGDIFSLTLRAKSDALSAGDMDIQFEPQLRNADSENVETETEIKIPVTVYCMEHKYGDLVPEVPAKCGIAGKKAYYECSVCHKLFNENKTEVTAEQLVIPALTHVAEEGWHSDVNNHWKVCVNGCGTIIDGTIAAHKFEWKTDKPATEDETGIQHEECTVCGYKRSENTEIPKLPHVHTGITHHEAVAANCHETGTVEYWTCSSDKCKGKYYSDSDCTTEIQSVTTPIDKNNHDGDTEVRDAVAATCNKDGYTGDTYCLGCGEKIAEGKTIPATGEHVNASGKWESDGANHWQVCDSCGTEFNKAAHEGGEATCSAKAVCEVCSAEYGKLDPDNHVNTEIRGAVAATEEAEGYTGDKWCLDCDQMIEEGTVIAKLDHTHAMVKTEAKAATCEEDGNIEYYTCSKCGKKYNDEAGTRELRDEEIIIEAAGHSYSTEWKSDADSHWHECTCGERSDEGSHTFGDWTVTKEATETADGSRERKCTVCGYVQSDKISAIGGATDDTESGGTDSSGDSDTPQTGDNTNAFLWLALMAAGGCGLIVTTVAKKYRTNK